MIWVGPIRALPGKLMFSYLPSFLVRSLRDIKPWGRQLQNPSVGKRKESHETERIKDDWRKSGKERNNELIASDFLGPGTEIFGSALIPLYQIPSILPTSLPFPWNQLELGFSECGSDGLVLYPSQFCYISQTQREKLICASTFESEIIYSLLRIGLCRKPNTVHQHPWVGVPLVWMSVYLDWAWMTPEADPAFTLREPGQSCHFLDQKLRNTASGRYHPGSRSPAHPWGLCSLEICCISSPANSGEDRIHTSQPEPYLPLPSYPELACSQVCFVFSFNFFLSFFFF